MNDKGDEGELLEDDGATVARCGMQDGSCLFVSCLSNASPPPRRAKTAAPSVDAAASPAVLDEDTADRRAREECRAWCADMSRWRCRAREEERQAREAETLGEPDRTAPLEITEPNPPIRKLLTTQKTPQGAEHSFNGVMFDVEAKGSYEVVLDSVHVGGMLGHMRVYACWGSWTGDPTSTRHRGYGHQYDVRDQEHWKLVASVRCKPMWNSTTEVQFDQKVRLLPGQRRAIYVHSALPDDLGLQYHTTRGNERDAVDEDEFVALYPGVGHTSSTPFDRDYGWYRHPRCLAGKLGYSARLRTWTPKYHAEFPDPLKGALRTMLLAQGRGDCVLHQLPVDLIFQVMEKCEWEHFGSGALAVTAESSEDEDEYQTDFERQLAALGRHGGNGGGPMVRVEVEGRQLDVPMNILMQLMGHNGHPPGFGGGYEEVEDGNGDEVDSDMQGSSSSEDDDDEELEVEAGTEEVQGFTWHEAAADLDVHADEGEGAGDAGEQDALVGDFAPLPSAADSEDGGLGDESLAPSDVD